MGRVKVSRSAPRLQVGVTLTDSSTREKLVDFCRALGDASGFDVTPVGVWYYQRLLEAVDVGDIDVVWLPPILAAQATRDRHAIPIALPVRGGVSAYSTALFAREGSKVRRLEDLQGARAAWVDRQSVSGYLLIRAHLRARGVDPDRALGEGIFLGSHEAVARAVLDGAADVGATFVYLDAERDEPLQAGWGHGKVQVIASAGPIPADVLAVSACLDPKRARAVQRLLIHQGHPNLRTTSAALIGTDVFTQPNPAHIEALAALLPSLDAHAQPHRAHWPRGV